MTTTTTKKMKVGTCAYCAAPDLELTIEHVFPESWYPDDYAPGRMLTVPACLPCNQRYGKIEARLFVPLVLSLPTQTRTATLVARAKRSVDEAAAGTDRDAAHREAKRVATMKRIDLVAADEPADAVWTPSEHAPMSFVTEEGVHVAVKARVEFKWEDMSPR